MLKFTDFSNKLCKTENFIISQQALSDYRCDGNRIESEIETEIESFPFHTQSHIHKQHIGLTFWMGIYFSNIFLSRIILLTRRLCSESEATKHSMWLLLAFCISTNIRQTIIWFMFELKRYCSLWMMCNQDTWWW